MKKKKNILESLNTEEDKYRIFFESNRDSITLFRINSSGNPSNFIEVNEATTELFGYTKKELLNMCVYDVETISDEVKSARISAILTHGKTDFETIIKDKQGNNRIVEIHTKLITYDNEPAVMNITREITERKLIEGNAKKVQENLNTILEAIPDLLFEVGLDSKIYFFKSHNTEVIATLPNGVIGAYFKDILPIRAAKTCFDAIKEADKNGWSMGKQYSLQLPKGKYWFELSVSPIKENTHTNKRFIVLARDITERKLAEQELNENKENLQSIFDSVSEAIFVIDQKAFFIDVNKGAEKMYQYTRHELIGKTPQFVSASGLNDFKEVYRTMQSVFKNGIPKSIEFWAMRKNGEIFPKEIVANRGKYLGKDVLIVTARDISERKTAENALRKSEEKLKNIFNLANSGIILADIEGNFIEFNNWWLKMTGYTREEYSKMKKNGVSHPDDFERSKMWLNKIINGEIDKYQLEKRYLRKDKSVFWGESSVSAIKDKNNTITSTICIVSDITERKIAEELLRESEEKYRGLVENSPDGIVTYIQDKITYVNSEALRIVGAKTPDQIIGRSVLEFIHPDSTESIIHRMKDVMLNDNASQVVEEKLISLNSETIYAELKAIPTIFKQRNAVQVIIHDITERKRTQDKIKQLSQAVEQSPVAIVITNTMGEIEYINSKFLETSGYTVDEVIGKNTRFLKSGHTSKEEYKQLWQTLSAGHEWYGEFHNKKKDGTLYWELASISPILNTQGITTHYIAIKENITERKLIEQQLINAKNKAEESDRLKLAFLANMSHEIRTPMNGILGFTELLKDNSLAHDVQQDYIKIIEKSGKRMLNIINDIISISKIESGQIDVTTSETNINELIEYLHTFFKPEASHKNIALKISSELSSKNNHINTDREKLYAILTNLIKNAIKFTTDGFIEFGCEKKGDFLKFFVKDSGLGISDSQQKIIFERFRQANDTISRTHEGSGLGLAISKAYVEILGGEIWVESQEGIGSTFHFTLPYLFENIHEEKFLLKKSISTTKEKNKVNSLKVLIVEDDPISKLLITIALKSYSKEILKVSTGFEAIEACRDHPDIDLVMMDINMPEMGGYEATKQIRNFNKDIVIIAQTANGMQSDHDDAIAAGCTDYISKPINIKTLSNLIQKHFKK